jgi:integrase
MPRLVHQNPSYRKHRASGQAIVTLDGRDHYLGPHGTKASKAEYDRLIGEWLANGRRSTPSTSNAYVSELIEGFWTHAETYYGGTPHRGELGSYRLVLQILKRLYGRTFVRDFGPSALKGVRQAMIEAGWVRSYVNRQTGRLRHVFKWGVEHEYVPVTVYQTLLAVTGLKKGKTEARESDPVKPVPEEYVYALRDHVSRQVWAIIQLQLITGMRPGEACAMRGTDIDTTGKLWTYKPAKHKTEHHGYERTVYLGQRAQAIVKPFLKPDLHAYLFSPAEAEAERRAKLHAQRVAEGTPLSCGNRPGSNVKRKPGRKPRDCYSENSYRRAIDYACEKAFPLPADLERQRVKGAKWQQTRADGETSTALRWETRKEWKTRLGERWGEVDAWRNAHHWHPHQLRHNAATRLRKEYGLEAAQVILGHATIEVTELYAEKNVEAAMRIMGEVG